MPNQSWVKGQDGLKRLHEHIGESLALGARATGGNQSRKEKAGKGRVVHLNKRIYRVIIWTWLCFDLWPKSGENLETLEKLIGRCSPLLLLISLLLLFPHGAECPLRRRLQLVQCCTTMYFVTQSNHVCILHRVCYLSHRDCVFVLLQRVWVLPLVYIITLDNHNRGGSMILQLVHICGASRCSWRRLRSWATCCIEVCNCWSVMVFSDPESRCGENQPSGGSRWSGGSVKPQLSRFVPLFRCY